jgi:FAD-dependent oxidoreductase domain-containing protein 1
MTESADIVIVGGAAIGSSIAYHVANDPAFKGRVVVIEKDPTYQFSASALSAASIRQQYSSAINIRMSLYGIQFMREIGERLAVNGDKPAIDLHEGGYLYLAASENAVRVLRENWELQQQEGADILLFTPEEAATRYPWLTTDDLHAATWGQTGEGWFDGWGLMQAFRKKARALGVTYIDGEVVDIERANGRVVAVKLKDGSRITCGALVNAAGASGARQLAEMGGIAIPVVSKKRCVFTFTCKAELGTFPMLIDASGCYARPEGQRSAEGQMFICGSAPAEENDPDTDDFDVDYALFEEHVWPTLATRVPAFESIRPGRAWAGHYDMNLFDANAILGPVPELPNFYLANGFSGHGLQQSPAVGRGLAELLVHGRYLTLDLSEAGFERIAANRPLLEKNVI